MSFQARKVKFVRGAMAEVEGAYRMLGDAHDRIVVNGSDEKTVCVPYSFEPEIYIVLSKNLSAMQAAMEATETARKTLIKKHARPETPDSLDPKNPEDAEALGAFMEDFNKLVAGEETVRLLVLKISHLNVGSKKGQNPIPTKWLAPLFSRKLLEDDKLGTVEEIEEQEEQG